MGRQVCGCSARVENTVTIVVHPTARVSPLADIEDSVRGSRIIVGAGVVIDSFVKIKPVGGSGDVVLGENVVINSGCVIYSGNGVRIGDNTAVAANTVFAALNHEYRDRTRLIRDQRFAPSRGGIDIGEDVWIGAGCVLLDGARLGSGCVIGALSLVRGQVEPYTVNAGNPLKCIGVRS